MQAGPIVGEKNRVAGIRGIVLHAGNLTGGDARKMEALFEAGNILRGFVRDAGNRICVVDKLLYSCGGRAGAREHAGAGRSFAVLAGHLSQGSAVTTSPGRSSGAPGP